MDEQIIIRHPLPTHVGDRAIHRSTFVAAGTATGNITDIRCTITKLTNGKPAHEPIPGIRFFVVRRSDSSGQNEALHWMFYFRLQVENINGQVIGGAGYNIYEIDAIGYDINNAEISRKTVRFEADPHASTSRIPGDFSWPKAENKQQPLASARQATFTYPQNDHVITGSEKEYLVTYGDTNRPIVSVELRKSDTSLNATSNSVYTYAPDNFWCATLANLSTGTGQKLRVIDADDQGEVLTVSVA